MSRYTKLEAQTPDVSQPDISVKSPKYESFQLEKEKELMPFVKKFKIWCYILIALSIPMPIAGWFVEENHIIFYESLAFFLAQIGLAILGLRTLTNNMYRRLASYKKFIHIYFLALIGIIIANEVIITIVIINHNDSHCEDFDFNKVCKGRWGIMGAQLTLILFYPLIDFTILVLYRYFLQVVNELMNSLLQRDL